MAENKSKFYVATAASTVTTEIGISNLITIAMSYQVALIFICKIV